MFNHKLQSKIQAYNQPYESNFKHISNLLHFNSMNPFSLKRNTRKQTPSFMILILFVLAYLCTSSQIEIVSETIMRKIFQETTDQLIVIYVCEQKDSQFYNTFSSYCSQHVCAYLDKHNDLYDSMRVFIGYPNPNYLLILDSPKQLKYVHEIQGTLQYDDIDKFVADFKSQELIPYFTSQEQPEETDEYCRKLVGVNFDKFMALEAPIKVVYLHIEHQSCEACEEMLRGFSDIAEKIYRQDVIAFGYFDIFKNDHPLISSQVAPFFLVFIQGENEPYGIEGEKFPQLEKALINIIAEHIYPDYRKDQTQDEEEYTQVEIEDIEDFETFYKEESKQPNNNRNFQL